MAARQKILTADRLLLRGWDNDYFCPMCFQNLEMAPHILSKCPWSFVGSLGSSRGANLTCQILPRCAVWLILRLWIGCRACIALRRLLCGKVQSRWSLVCWEIWNERNRRIFRKKRAVAKTIAGPDKRRGQPLEAGRKPHPI